MARIAMRRRLADLAAEPLRTRFFREEVVEAQFNSLFNKQGCDVRTHYWSSASARPFPEASHVRMARQLL